MNKAFVLGNGTSRSGICLESLRNHGRVYGCNALYRSYDPDFLVCVDKKMIEEINEERYQYKNNSVWTYANKFPHIKNLNNFPFNNKMSSGPAALMLASIHNYDQIYMLGFDFFGLNKNTTYNNLYAGTRNYKKITDNPIFYKNWIRQIKDIVNCYTDIVFTRVVGSDFILNDRLFDHTDNIKHLTMENFKSINI